MDNNASQKIIENLLEKADIRVNGNRPWDIQVHQHQLYSRLIRNPEFEFGETYMDGWWDCPQLDELFYRIFSAHLDRVINRDKRFIANLLLQRFKSILTTLINYQSKSKALEVGKRHYDLSNHLFQEMLDPLMNYSCGYWKETDNLADAQIAKLDLVCRKLQLKQGMHVLDIGCGWGSFAKYAAEKYGVSVIGVTISKKQYEYARHACEGLPIEIKLQDYRDIEGTFDRICSIGMFEHVGYKNYSAYMNIVHQRLKDDGLFLLHTIGNNISITRTNAWIDHYIFPNGCLPSIKQIGAAIENLFVMEDWHNFGADYDKTLMAWHQQFNQHWEHLNKHYDERFRRLWNFYLLSCAGTFRARDLQLWQIVLSKKGVPDGYVGVR